MNASLRLLGIVPLVAVLVGCSGSGAPPLNATPTTQNFGPLTTRIVGTVQAPVVSSAAFGANVTGIAGAQVDQLTLNFTGPDTLSDTKIAFVSIRDGNDEIYAMNADGSGQTRLTNNAADDYEPSFSADGSKIAFYSYRDGNYEIYVMNADGSGQTRLTNNAAIDYAPSWSGFLARTPKTLIGSGGALGAAAAGFLFGQKNKRVTSVVGFDTSTTTLSARAASRVSALTSPETQGSNLIFSITTTVGLGSISYAPVNEAGVPGTAVSPTIPTGSTNALVTFDAADGTVVSVVPFTANRSVGGLKTERNGEALIVKANFTAVFDASGKNLAPGGAKSVTIDEKSGKLLGFE